MCKNLGWFCKAIFLLLCYVGVLTTNQVQVSNSNSPPHQSAIASTLTNQISAATPILNGAAAIVDTTMDMKSIQAAYSMGSMSIKAYRTTTDNPKYNTKGGSVTVNEIALGLSF